MNPKPESALPSPDADSLLHSARVADHIGKRIDAAGGSISFAEFMHEALYAPGLGYYSAGARKFGADGDFVTAPEISSLFGYVIARQLAFVFDQMGGGDVLELGPGTGKLAVDILTRLGDLDALPDSYRVLEVSPDLRERQQARLKRELPAQAERVSWITDLPASFSGVVLANEVADALPVERFRVAGGDILQARVAREGDGFAWQYDKASTVLEQAVRDIEQSLGTNLPHGYESEVSLALRHWIEALCGSIGHGLILLFDYGVSRREYYAPDRHDGWLRCHFRHHAHNDPLVLAGIQDLTTWVDFTSIAETASAAGMRVTGYTSQAGFLMHGGLDVELGHFVDLPLDEQVVLSSQVKQLTLPAEMGENFKCIGLQRGDMATPPAFCESDRTHFL